MNLVITLPGTIESKAQMVAPGVGVRAKVPVTSEVIRHSQRSLWILEVIWACFQGGHLLGSAPLGCSFVPAPAEVAGSGLFSQVFLSQASPAEVTGLGLVWWSLLPWVCSCGGGWLGAAPAEVAGLGSPWLRSLGSWLLPHMSLAWAWSQGGCWLRLAPSEVAPLLKVSG